MTHTDLLDPWVDSSRAGARSNGLMRENWLTLNEFMRVSGDVTVGDLDGLDELLDLLIRCQDIERKYAATRSAEFAETQRQWYVRAFGPEYERELEWDRTSSFKSRQLT